MSCNCAVAPQSLGLIKRKAGLCYGGEERLCYPIPHGGGTALGTSWASLNRYNSVVLNRVQSGTLALGYLQYYSGLKVIPVHCVDLELCSPLSNRGS